MIGINGRKIKRMNKKIMHTSNLAMRFYVHNGWTLEELEGLVESHRDSTDGRFRFFDDTDSPYYVPNVGTNLKIKELAEKISEIKKAFNDYPNETNKECIERFNW